jgi:hypothetical protein
MRLENGLMAVLAMAFALTFTASNAGASVLISDPNLLSNKDAVASSVFGTNYASCATDGAGAPDGTGHFIFGNDADQRLVIHGFDSSVSLIRIWSCDNSLSPTQVTIKSSTTNTTSLTAADYDTSLTTGAVALTASSWGFTTSGGMGYVDFNVNAPTGTKSLYFNFGGTNAAGWAGVADICEVQAFSSVPEPSAIALVVSACLGLLAYAWRKRR